MRISRDASRVRLLAKVCVNSLPPDPQGNRTRISWDPWSIQVGSRAVRPNAAGATGTGSFPADATYKVGQCASGWIPFATNAKITRISYHNGVGDTAVWNPTNLAAKPTTQTSQQSRTRAKTKITDQVKDYDNCTALHADYPHGVGRPGAHDKTQNGSPPVTTFTVSKALYDANSESDRDRDGIACERL